MISPAFQRSLSAGEVAGLCSGLVMGACYCGLCFGAGCFLGPGFVFTLGVSLLVYISSSAQGGGGAFWASCGAAADEAGVFFLLRSSERALRSSLGPPGRLDLKRGFTFVPRVFVLIGSCQAAVFILLGGYLTLRGEISCSAGWWVSRMVIHKAPD